MNRTCKLCGKEFEAHHYFALCPSCRTRKCLICGKEFNVVTPYTQVTCSKKCSGIYRKESGISKEVAKKTSETLLKRYGVANPATVTKPTEPKICPICGESFIPDTFRQVYCKNKHYGPCPVCGKTVEIKRIDVGPQCCSEECRVARIKSTCTEKYGNSCFLSSDTGKKAIRESCMKRYGVPDVRSTAMFQEKMRSTMVERYGVANALQNPDILAKAQETNIERYGGIAPTCDSDVVQKSLDTQNRLYGGIGFGSPITSEKIRDTTIARYGTDIPQNTPEVREKTIQTCLERYGDTTPSRSPSVIAKRDRTMLERYGVKNILQLPERAKEIRAAADATILSKYGVTNPSYLQEFIERSKATCMKHYGVPFFCMTDKCQSAVAYHRISKTNKRFSSCLIHTGLAHIMEYRISNRPYDFNICGVLVEIDPTITHNSAISIFAGDDPKPSDYHLRKTMLANDHGFRCIHVFDWDDCDSIIDLFAPKIDVYARNCDVRTISRRDAETFTKQYHIQGSCRGQNICYGLFYNDELVEVMTFGKPRYNKRYDYELLRLCSHTNYRVIGGASRLFKHFIRDNPDKTVISYCNLSKFTGDVYTKIGMKFDSTTPPAKIWSKDDKFITDNVLRQRGYDQLFGTDYGKGTSNEQLMLDNGWLPVYDCGQAVYVYEP